MAEMKSVRKMFRKKRFKRFENCFKDYLENDLRLQSLVKNICLKRTLWNQFIDSDDSEDSDDNDFLGFDANSNRIQELLQKQWQRRIRQLNDQKKPNNILRKARLEISSKTLQRIRSGHQLSRSGQPGYITCAICGTTKYYSHVQRRYGVFSCEPCSKFFARFLKSPQQLFCSKSGDCPVIAVNVNRCRACWLKVCLQKFQIDQNLRQTIGQKFAPKSSTNQLSLITVDTSDTKGQSKGQSGQRSCAGQPLLMVAHSTGPRVKRVCRRTVSGLPVATFGPQIPDSEDSDELPVDVYLCRAVAEHKRHSQSAQGVKSA